MRKIQSRINKREEGTVTSMFALNRGMVFPWTTSRCSLAPWVSVPLQVRVDAVQGVCVTVRVLELHPTGEAQVVFAEAQLLHGLLRGHQPQTLQGGGRRGKGKGLSISTLFTSLVL